MSEGDTNWICPTCSASNSFSQLKCACGYLFAADESVTCTDVEVASIKVKDQNEARHLRVCPYCEEKIHRDAIKCPYCAEKVNNAPSASSSSMGVTSTLPEHKEGSIIPKITPKTDLPFIGIGSVKVRIKRLEALLTEGIITQEEFTAKRQQIITGFLESEESS